jgi:NAD(P)H-dependent flavin oxidoreductase YrpB (nitropropane dioxygenase family)
MRTGQPLAAQRLVEDAERVPVAEAHQGLLQAMHDKWVIGDPAYARKRIADLAAEFGVDEVMVHPVAGGHVGGDPRTAPGREQTLRLLAG